MSLSLSISALTWETLSEGEEGDEECAPGLREGSVGDDPLVSGPLASGAVAGEEGRSGVKLTAAEVGVPPRCNLAKMYNHILSGTF